MKALITGITGFAGSHLAEHLLEQGVEVHGIYRWRSRMENIEHLKDKIKLHLADMKDPSVLRNLINEVQPDYIFHLAAQSYVPVSWTEPVATTYVNYIGTLNLFEAVRASNCDPAIQVAGCYDKITKAFTENGLVNYKNLKIGQKVLSLDPKTKEVSFKKITKVIIDKYKGPMYHFKSKSCDLLVTPNHKILCKNNKKDKLKFQRADELTGRNILPLGKTKSKKNSFSGDLCYLIGLFIGDGYLVPCKKVLQWSGLSHNEYIKIRNKKGQFKKIEKKQLKEYISQRAFLAIPKNDKARKSAEKVLQKLNIKYSAYDKELYFNPPSEILSHLVACSKFARNKRIPKYFLNQNYDCLLMLFKGLIDSDGHYRKNRFGYTTISKQLVNDIIELTSKIGKWVTISERKERNVNFGKRIIKSQKSYEFSITEGEKILTKTSNTNKKIENYSGDIWCVEVEDNHNLLIERNGKVTFCGNSSEEYGTVLESECPIKETNPLRPLSPYAVTKVACDKLCYQYNKSYGMKTIATRGFNHTGPRRGEVFVTSNFAKQIVQIEKGINEPVMYVGNLEARRDFTDVRDTVRGYHLAVQKCKPGQSYNICSGKTWRIQQVLDILLNLSTVNVQVRQDPSRMRPSDLPLLLGDNTKFKMATGWEPTIPFEKTMADLMDYWRARI